MTDEPLTVLALTRRQMRSLVLASQLATRYAPAYVAEPLALAEAELELTTVLALSVVKQPADDQTALPLVAEPAARRDPFGTNST